MVHYLEFYLQIKKEEDALLNEYDVGAIQPPRLLQHHTKINEKSRLCLHRYWYLNDDKMFRKDTFTLWMNFKTKRTLQITALDA